MSNEIDLAIEFINIGFSRREVEILKLLCIHKTRPKVAEILHIELTTVKSHIRRILALTKFEFNIELIDYFYPVLERLK